MKAASDTARLPVDPIVLRAVTGDREAEREVCRRNLPAIRAFAQRRLPLAAAEDFAQDALILLLEAMREGRVQEPARLAAFALGICRNLSRDRARTGERRRELQARYGVSDDDLIAPAESAPVRRGHLEDCYSQLTDSARRVLRATFCDDWADARIAGELALSEANVRVIRHRTLATLRSCLERPISWRQA
jgi:RNA polymerase sigma-70 factor (ECF subfamily)